MQIQHFAIITCSAAGPKRILKIEYDTERKILRVAESATSNVPNIHVITSKL